MSVTSKSKTWLLLTIFLTQFSCLTLFSNTNGRKSENYYQSILGQKEENHQHNMPGVQVKFRLEAANTNYCC